MDQHLTVSEAREFTGKSESTIKRMLREIVSDRTHPDRLFILPSEGEVERRKAAKEPYAWKIDRQLLLRRFPQDEPVESGGAMSPGSMTAPSELVMQVLQEQLTSKDEQLRTLEKQLDRKDEQIASLNERMRESNVLMRELQQRLAITAPKSATTESFLESKPRSQDEKADAASPAPKPQTTKPHSKKPKKAEPVVTQSTTKKAPRKGFFRRLFG